MIRINFGSEMSSECLICSSPCPLDVDHPDQGRSLEFDSSGLLDKELETIFLLRNVLLVPATLCQQFVKERGHPSEWGLNERLCPLCRRVLAESHFVFNRMQKLAKEYETLCGKLRAKAEGVSAYLQNGFHRQGQEEDTVAHKVQWHLISRNYNNNNYNTGINPIIKPEPRSKVIKNIFPKPAKPGNSNKAKPWSKVKRKPPTAPTNNASELSMPTPTPASSNSNSAAAKTARAIAIAKARANANLARRNGTQLPTTSNIKEEPNPEILSVKTIEREGEGCDNDDGSMGNIKVEAVLLDDTADNGQWFHFPTLELQPPKKRRGRPPGLGYKPPKLKKIMKKKNKKKGVSKVKVKFQKPKTSVQAKSFIMQRRFTFEPQPWEEGPNYSCDICSNTFTHPKTLEIHTAFHNNTNLLPCPQCEAKCSRQMDFEMHVKGHETNENAFVCYVCFKPFRWKKDNIRHIRKKHLLEKTYRCLYCTIRLKTNTELEEHISENHSNRRNYACKYCSKRFSQKRYMQNHLAGVHRMKASLESDDPNGDIECDIMEESASGMEVEHDDIDDPLGVGHLGEVDISDVEWDENEMEGYQDQEQGGLQEDQQDVEEEEEVEENMLGYNFSMSVAEEPEFDHEQHQFEDEEPQIPQYEHEEPEFVNEEPEPALI